MFESFKPSCPSVIIIQIGVLGYLRERETYIVVKDCKVENQGGTSEASKLLLLKSLPIMQT